ncbi:MAG: hypothetical protein RJB39_200 [Candidatus Parcubacteria bacterium]
MKKTTQPKEKHVIDEHAHVFRTLQHFGFTLGDKPHATQLEEKIIAKKTDKTYIIDTLAIQKSVLDKTFSSFNFPVHIGYSHDKDSYIYHIVGTKKSIYDALAIEAGYSVIQELTGSKAEILVELNFIGDKESVQRFSKELQHFYKRHAAAIPKNILSVAKKDPFASYRMLEGVELKPKAAKKGGEVEAVVVPNPVDYLSEISRKEFKEVLEYIESLDMNFRINPFLYESPDVVSGIIFNVHTMEKGTRADSVSIFGTRNDVLGKKILNKKEVPTISVVISGLKKIPKQTKIIKVIKHTEIKFFYAQLGPEARFKTLKVMDMMRCAKIPLHHAISKEKISAQLAHAEKLNIPYLLLVGHREALQNSVMVRNMKNLSQESITMDNLIEYLKKLM